MTKSPTNRTLTVGLAIFAKSKEADKQWANVCAAALVIIAPLLASNGLIHDELAAMFAGVLSQNRLPADGFGFV